MESDEGTVLLGIMVGSAMLVLFGPPFLLLFYRRMRHRRGRWLRRSAHRNHR